MDETVMHDDDFSYECSEVEVVYEEGESLPDSTIDLTDDTKVYTFYNSQTYPFSNYYRAPVELDSMTYPSGEQAWLSFKYTVTAPEIAKRIREAETVDAAHVIDA